MDTDLTGLRNKLNSIDRQIVNLLEQRLKVTDIVGEIKVKNNLPFTDSAREKEVIERLQSLTTNIYLKENVGKLYEHIFELVKNSYVFRKTPVVPFSKIGIIGAGLIGGSIIKAIRLKNPESQIFTLKRPGRELSESERSYVTQEYTELEEFLQNSELIVLGVPIESTIPLAVEIANTVKNSVHKLLVIDVASVKKKIAEKFEKLTTETVDFIPTHPMSGSHHSGFAHAQSTLFINKPWIITPHKHNAPSSIKKIEQFVTSIGAKSHTLSPDEHDTQVAAVSHLVFMISTLLFAFVNELHSDALQIAGSGFETTTRLASGNVPMHDQIFNQNKVNILKVLNEFNSFTKNSKLNSDTSVQFFTENKITRDSVIKKI